MHTGMIPPAATPPSTRLRKSTADSGQGGREQAECEDAHSDFDHPLFAVCIACWAEKGLAQAKGQGEG